MFDRCWILSIVEINFLDHMDFAIHDLYTNSEKTVAK